MNRAPVATLADAVAARLHQHGVRMVFGIPGTHNLELFRALGLRGIEVTPAHHEQGLGYAADAYSRVTGEPAVVVTTTGPGITNLITALATSAAASVPVLAIAPGIPESGAGRGEGWLHDLPSQIELMSRLVRSSRVASSAEAVLFIDATVRSWSAERPLPAYLEIPFDLFGQQADELVEPPETPVPVSPGVGGAEPHAALRERIEQAAAMLAGAQSPLIIAGRGATNEVAAAQLREIAEMLQAPVITTANAKGALDERHPLTLGVALRVEAGKSAIAASDALLVIGSDLGRSEFWGPPALDGATMIRVDVDARSMTANADPLLPLLGRTESVLPLLGERLGTHLREGRGVGGENRAAARAAAVREDLLRSGGVYRAFHEHVQDLCASREIAITGDSSQASYFGTASHWKASKPNRFLYPAGYGTLGYAVPAAIGAQLTGVLDRTLAVTGEGGLLFSAQELATLAELDLPVTVVVFANGGYKEIRDGMNLAGIPAVGVDFRSPDFVSVARGFHIEGRRVEADGGDELEFRRALEWALERQGPALIEVDIRAFDL